MVVQTERKDGNTAVQCERCAGIHGDTPLEDDDFSEDEFDGYISEDDDRIQGDGDGSGSGDGNGGEDQSEG